MSGLPSTGDDRSLEIADLNAGNCSSEVWHILSNLSSAYGEGHDAPCWPTAAEHTMSALGPTTANKMLTPYPANS
jgi:hypothetical protein